MRKGQRQNKDKERKQDIIIIMMTEQKVTVSKGKMQSYKRGKVCKTYLKQCKTRYNKDSLGNGNSTLALGYC